MWSPLHSAQAILAWVQLKCLTRARGTPQVKGTTSKGKRLNKSHTICWRCGQSSFHIQVPNRHVRVIVCVMQISRGLLLRTEKELLALWLPQRPTPEHHVSLGGVAGRAADNSRHLIVGVAPIKSDARVRMQEPNQGF